MISLCMCTYNGEKFIKEQLETIRKQTRMPDEVIICDDCSEDNTVKYIKTFIDFNGLTGSWKLYCNEKQKGYPGNFYYAMSLCKGDIIFLADQDDVWCHNKIAEMSVLLQMHSDMQLLAGGWGIIDAEGKRLQGEKRNADNQLSYISVEDILYRYEWPGMSICYRKELGQKVLESAGKSMVPHDVALVLAAAEEGGFAVLNKVYQFHRRHDNNVAMEEHRVVKRLNKGRKQQEIARYLNMLLQIQSSNILNREQNCRTIEKKIRIMKERKENLDHASWLGIIKQYIKNRKDIRLETMICDLIICKGK